MLTVQDIAKRYHGFLKYSALKVTKNDFLIEESISRSYLFLSEKQAERGSLDFISEYGEPNKLYLSRMVQNFCRKIAKAECRRSNCEGLYVDEIEPLNESVGEDTLASWKEDRERELAIKNAIEQETPYFRELFKLRYYGKKNQKELSVETQISHASIRSDLQKVRNRVRERLRSRGYELN